MTGRTALSAGDFLPDIRLTDQHGIAVPLHHQTIAGDPVVLMLCPAPIHELSGECLRPVLAAYDSFAALPTHMFVVSPADPDTHRLAARNLGQRWPPFLRLLADPGHIMLSAFGDPDEPVFAVLRPDMRIAALLPGHDIDGALALCRALPDDEITGMQAPVLIVDNIFPQDFCDELIGIWQAGEKYGNRVSGETTDYERDSIKRRIDVVVTDAAIGRRIQEYLTRRMLPELTKAFRFQVTEAERYRIGCYDAAESNYFRRHRDLGTAQTGHRAFALSLNLNDDYDGGEIVFPEYGTKGHRAPRGGGVIFSCGLLHEARPVTRGRRFALFTFFSGQMAASR